MGKHYQNNQANETLIISVTFPLMKMIKSIVWYLSECIVDILLVLDNIVKIDAFHIINFDELIIISIERGDIEEMNNVYDSKTSPSNN